MMATKWAIIYIVTHLFTNVFHEVRNLLKLIQHFFENFLQKSEDCYRLLPKI